MGKPGKPGRAGKPGTPGKPGQPGKQGPCEGCKQLPKLDTEENSLSTEANSLLSEDENESKMMEKLNYELDELEHKKGIKPGKRHAEYMAGKKHKGR
jgi:hypothetical protein